MSQLPLARLVHGSQDSTDLDVLYVMEDKPSFVDCQRFCSGTQENRNIIVVRDGVVVECFKGLPDEVNNALLRTYGLHAQAAPNPVLRPVLRAVAMKLARGVRVILTRLTRSPYRVAAKAALRSHDFNLRRGCLSQVDFRGTALSVDALKSMAFQFGQMLGLIHGRELYTKAEIAGWRPELEAILYRRPVSQGEEGALNGCRDELMEALRPVAVDPRGVLNLFKVSEDALDEGQPWLTQCRGALCDLRAERVVSMAPSSSDAKTLLYVERPDAPRFVGLAQWESPQMSALGRWPCECLASVLDTQAHQHFFELKQVHDDGACPLRLIAVRHRHTGDLMPGAEVATLNLAISSAWGRVN